MLSEKRKIDITNTVRRTFESPTISCWAVGLGLGLNHQQPKRPRERKREQKTEEPRNLTRPLLSHRRPYPSTAMAAAAAATTTSPARASWRSAVPATSASAAGGCFRVGAKRL